MSRVVRLAYGTSGLDIGVPAEGVDVVEPRYLPALPDPQAALRQALRAPTGTRPLRELVGGNDSVGIVVSDMTRPMPTAEVLRAILSELPHVSPANVTILVGLGTHRPMTEGELQAVLGAETASSYRIVQPDCHDASAFTHLGRSRAGHPIQIASAFLRCQVKIVTGLIEPHLFAGISGGPKGILPGLASLDTIIANHSPEFLLDPNVTWGVTESNPLWQEIREAALLTKPTFLVNVAVNRDKAITGVFAGEMEAAFARGAEFVRQTAMVAVPYRYDVVVTTNSGYPLDLNLYQAAKGMSAAAQIVKQGGAIIAASECCDGLPAGGRWERILRQAKTPEEIIAGIQDGRYAGADQWQLLLYAQILRKATVYLKTSYIKDDDVRACLAVPCHDVSATLRALLTQYGPQSRACILPEGPQTVPYLTTETGNPTMVSSDPDGGAE